MAKKIQDEILKLNIVINGNEAQKDLGKLEQSKHELIKKNNEFLAAKKELIKIGKKESNAFKELKTQLTENREENKLLLISKKELIREGKKESDAFKTIKTEIIESRKQHKALLKTQKELIEAGKEKTKEYRKIKKEVAESIKQNKQLLSSKQQLIKTGEHQSESFKDLTAQISKNKIQNKALLTTKTDLIKTGKNETVEFRKLTQEMGANKVATEKNASQQEALRRELGLTGLTMKQLKKQKKDLNRELENFTVGSDNYKKTVIELGKVEKQMTEVHSATKELKNTLNDDNGFSVFEEGLSNMLQGMKSADLGMVKKGFTGIKGSIIGMTKASIAFIATPLGATIAALALVAASTTAWVNFNLEIEKTNSLIRDITGTTGQTTDSIRSRAEALNEVFEVDITESVEVASSLVENMGISYDKAFDMIEDGAVRGKLKNDDFLDSLKEYPVQFKNAGFSADEFAKVVNTGIDMKIYSDKLPDAIKEADLALKEQTKATKEALVGAFGAPFTNDILSRINKGTITTKQALQEISKEATKTGLNQKQQAQLTADLFKGAGEDAGGSLKIFKALDTALNKEQKQLTETQKLRKKELATKQELNKVTTQMFASSSEGMNNLITKGKIWATETLIKILKGGVDLYNWFIDMNNESEAFSAILSTIGEVAKFGFKTISTSISATVDGFKGMGTVIEGLFSGVKTGNWNTFKKGFSEINDSIIKTAAETAVNVKESSDEIYNAFQGKNKKKKITLEALVTNETSNTKTGGTEETEEEKAIRLEKEKQERIAKAELFKKANEEINKLIAAQELAKKSALDRDIAAVKAKYKEEIALAKKHHLNEKATQLEAFQNGEIQALKDAETERVLQKKQEELDAIAVIEDENYLEREAQRLDREIEKAETDEEKALLLLEKVQYLADEQLRIEEIAELSKVETLENAEAMKDAIREKYRLKRAKVDAEFDKGVKKSKKEEQKRDKILNEQKVQQYSTMFGNISTILGKHTTAGKAAAVAQTTIDTYLGAQKAYTSQIIPGDPTSIFRAVIAGGAAVATGIANIKKITATDTSVPGYEDGLYQTTRTDGKKFNAKLGKTETGLVTQPTLMDGSYLAGERSTARNPEMIIDDRTFAKLDPRIPAYIMAVKNGTYTGFEEGKYNQSSTDIVDFDNETTTEIKEENNVSNLLRQLIAATEKGTNVSLLFGYEDAEKVRDLLNEIDSSKQNGKVGQ